MSTPGAVRDEAGRRPSSTWRRAAVISFDQQRGLGSLCTGNGGEAGVIVRFHATAITDGSRVIDTGTAVLFALRAAHGGTWEAAFVAKFPGDTEACG